MFSMMTPLYSYTFGGSSCTVQGDNPCTILPYRHCMPPGASLPDLPTPSRRFPFPPRLNDNWVHHLPAPPPPPASDVLALPPPPSLASPLPPLASPLPPPAPPIIPMNKPSTFETLRPGFKKDLIRKLNRLKELQFGPDKGQYFLIMDTVEDFLILCYKIGTNPSFTADEANLLGPLIAHALLGVSGYITEMSSTLEEININLGKAVRSGLELLLTETAYKNLPVSAGETLSETLQDFLNNEHEEIDGFDQHLKALRNSLGPSYAEEVRKREGIPYSHWWWNM